MGTHIKAQTAQTRCDVRAMGGASTAICFKSRRRPCNLSRVAMRASLCGEKEQWLQGHTSEHWAHL